MKTLFTIFLIFLGFILKSQSINFYVDTDNGCAPLTVQFTNTTGGDTTGMKFFWDVNGNIIDSTFHLNHEFIYAGNYRVTLKGFDSGNSYVGEFSSYIYVRGNPGYVTSNKGNNLCTNEEARFRVNGNYWDIQWSFSDGFSSTNWSPTHSFANEGTYQVQFIGNGDCGIDTIISDFIVSNNSVPAVNIWAHGGGTFCPNSNIFFNNDFDAKYYLWNFGDGSFSTSKNPTHFFTNPGNYNIILTVTNECGNTNKDTVTVIIDNNMAPNSWFNSWPSNTCPNENFNFYTAASGNYFWDLGDGTTSTLNQFYHSYADTGAYTVMLVVSNSCGQNDTTYNTVYVQYNTSNPPTAQFVMGIDYNTTNSLQLDICPNTEVRFGNTSWGNGNVNYLWDFGDGNTSTERDPSHIFTNTGMNTVTLIAYNSCGGADTMIKYVNVDLSIMPESNLQNIPSNICPGEAVYFYDDNRDYTYVYNIWFGDGDSLLNITETDTIIEVHAAHVYSAIGTYNFIYTATNTCGNNDTLQGTITVDDSGTATPFYYVMNSTTQEDLLSRLSNFQSPQSGTEHIFDLNVLFPGWQAGFNDTAVVAFWYDAGTNFDSEPDGYIIIDGFGAGTAYVPVNGDSISILGVWWCNGLIENDPSAFGMGGVFELTASGNTTVPNITLEGWDGSCTPAQNPNAGCPGDEINFFALGGISYLWHFGDGNTSNQSMTSHIYNNAGIYNAFVEITNGCGNKDTIYSTVEIINNKIPNASFDYNTNGSNCGDSPIDFYVRENNDNPNNTYSWDFGDGNTSNLKEPVHTFNQGGQFNVVLTVTNNCGISNSNSRDIWVHSPKINSIYSHGCQGENNGFIEIETIDAWYPVNYLWSSGQTTQNISSLSPGTYTLTVTDQSGCNNIQTFELNTDNPVDVMLLKTDISCNGQIDGSIDATVTGGNAPYYIYWDNGSENYTINNLSIGTYTINVIDGNACQVIKAVDINEPDVLVSSTDVYDQTCFDLANGSIDLTVNGGTPPYSYSWTGGFTVQDPSNLAEGTYNVTVTDFNNCTSTSMGVISKPVDITVSENITDASCGNSDGSIDLTVNGGTSPYSFTWSNFAITEDLSGLPAGTYDVTVSDANSCTKTYTYVIQNPGAPTVALTSNNGVTCNGFNDGSLTISISGGVSPYSILWNNTESTATISNLAGGNYSVTVTAADACKAILSNISVFEPGSIEITSVISNQTCSYTSDGSIDLTVNGGSPGYSYLWNTSETTEDLSNIYAATYSVTVTDANNCNKTGSFTLTAPAAFDCSVTSSDISCYGANDGSIDLTLINGVAPFTYNWTNSATTQDVTGLSAGTTSVTVIDANGCETNNYGVIAEPDDILISETITDLMCYGDLSGIIDITASGGTGSLSYLWSNSEVTEDLVYLSGGTYFLTVTDANNCNKTKSFAVIEPSEINLSTVIVNQSCSYSSDGSIDLTVTGGTGAYSYLWNTSETTEDLSNIYAATYSVTVTDANNCAKNGSYTLVAPATFDCSVTSSDISCYGANDGSIDLTLINGVAPFTYNWTNGSATQDVTGLSAGTTSVTVTDANGCETTNYGIINEPAEIVSILDIQDSLCYETNEAVVLDAGNAGTSYVWSTGGTTQTDTIEAVELGIGTHYIYVTITNNGCSVVDSIEVIVDICDIVNNVIAENNIEIYPNPSSDGKFNVVNLELNSKITVYDMNGKKVIDRIVGSDNVIIDLSSMPNGIYNLTIINKKSTYSKRIVFINN